MVILVVVGILLAGTAGLLYIQRRPTDDLTLPSPTAAPPAGPPRTLGQRLSKTRHAVGDRITGLLKRGRLDDEFWNDLEETLIAGDVGVATASAVVGRVRDSGPSDTDAAHAALQSELEALFAGRDRSIRSGGDPAVMVVVGVNGTGKTTSIAKLGHRLIQDGSRVVLGAADTFRAGAAEQLETWAGRIGAEFVGGEANSDPAAVAYRALQRGNEIGADVVIIDTAGRLHSNKNLMEELAKIVRVLTREAGEIDETLLVLDATTGQNAIAQAGTFTDVVGVSGIVLTKLDGTARGGVVVAVEQELDIPVKLVGVGEGMEDLLTFEPASFVAALLGDEG
ncbi:MAG: signal recognition particle-docking protein FtsY [Acidimicrobiia bacterium]|nr:signal recognition particle-docking protein FtsY [Acidimicrobiia bacterium]MBT8215370.1 signal recognition particle-docking protein FtsY [Acidimicrobiia bacterium]NNF10682.1 signal recognition particle-docking protein FtsY [Acidimicrobiia bacterium]NNL71668.1 signal recognition particle-docking protein FtsY [Acidimicrobiia bacterium]